MGKVIYLTGAPATGKSTLVTYLAKHYGVEAISYSTELINHINLRDKASGLNDKSIRELSSKAVTAEHVDQVDKKVIDRCRIARKGHNIIIDSHPVTKEHYGFRITGFKMDALTQLAPDVVCSLYADPEVIISRIKSDPGGRPVPTIFEQHLHLELQANVAATYGVITGSPVYLLNSDKSVEELAAFIMKKFET